MERNKNKTSDLQKLPSIVEDLRDIRCCDGDSASLECRFAPNKPPLDIRWEKDGKIVRLSGDFSADFDGERAKLSIAEVYPEDEGEYSCIAFNQLGKAVTSACLIVDLPEEKENLLNAQLKRPPSLFAGGATPISTPRTTPNRSGSPRRREPITLETKRRQVRALAPKFYAYPHNRIAEEGETVRFQCAVAGHPDPWVKWFKNNEEIIPTSRLSITEKEDLRTLEIKDITTADSAVYKVVLENDVGRVEATARLDVIAHRIHSTSGIRARSLSPKPAYNGYSKSNFLSASARYGSRARLFCDIKAVPTPYLKWYKDDVPIEEGAKFSCSYNGEVAALEIENVDFQDQGLYTCLAENENGRAQTSMCLEVLKDDSEPAENIQPYILTPLPSRLTELEGTDTTLQVRLGGSEPLDLVWMKDGCLLPDCQEYRQGFDKSGKTAWLVIENPQCEDSGRYTCEAYNVFGEASSKCHLTVANKRSRQPMGMFTKSPSSLIATTGAIASFGAKLVHDGNMKLFWEVNGQRIEPSATYKVEEEETSEGSDVITTGILHILDTCSSATVRCVAESQSIDGLVLCRSGTAHLVIVDRNLVDVVSMGIGAEPDSEEPQLPMSATADTLREEVLEYQNVNHLGMPVYRNPHGSVVEFVQPVEERAVPRDFADGAQLVKVEEPARIVRGPQDTTALVGDRVLLKATYVGNPEPSVKWTRASKQLKNDERTSITSGDGVSCLLLQNITTDDSGKYDVTVENQYGSECYFASVSVEGPPDPPSGTPTITAFVDTVTVAWSSSPYDGGKKVLGYIVEYSLCGSDIWSTAVDDCTYLSHAVGGLQPGGRYAFRVRAFNVHGISRPSAQSGIVQLEEHNESSSFEHRLVMTEPGLEFKSRYEVQEELGKGRFGVVHKVVDKSTNQKLAAKFIRCRTPKDKEKVQEEINIMNLLRHQKLLQLAAAFENPKETIMIMEYISGGELFERVVADDFTLTEKDCILFMRQICEGVAYMHSQNVVHLDLKPENIMCHTRTSHEIKIIDFGLAQKINPDVPVRVLFGTPEFIPPEIINYEPIGIESDMWSLGVICYVLLSGLSPFMGDTDSETFANITRSDYDFEDEAFNTVSQDARDFIGALLLKRKEDRLSADQCLRHVWLDPDNHQETVVLSTDKLKKFIIRRKWQKTGNAIRALGRMTNLSNSRRNSANSNPNTPRTSISGSLVPRMGSLEEEKMNGKVENLFTTSIVTESFDENDETAEESPEASKPPDNGDFESYNSHENSTLNSPTTTEELDVPLVASSDITDNVPEEVVDIVDPHELSEDVLTQLPKDLTGEQNFKAKKEVRTRACSERSDSGISDCSTYTHLTSSSCNSTPLLGKKFPINEEGEYKFKAHSDETSYVSSTSINLTSNMLHKENLRGSSEESDVSKSSSQDSELRPARTRRFAGRLGSKIECFQANAVNKSKPPPSQAESLKRLPNYSLRSVQDTIKKFDHTNPAPIKAPLNPENTRSSNILSASIRKNSFCDPTKLNPSSPILTRKTITHETSNRLVVCKGETDPPKITVHRSHSAASEVGRYRATKIDKLVQKLEKNGHRKVSEDGEGVLNTANPTVRFRSPSPSLLRKTQAVINKEKCNERYRAQNNLDSPRNRTPRSPTLKLRGNNECFQKVSAFWNNPNT
ncbi:hypothetical protein HUJ05_008917 [Dendroctonus ponderosae]|nr:hypothetical protein HUJ05_008917 [Dendroctonus ponderosae]